LHCRKNNVRIPDGIPEEKKREEKKREEKKIEERSRSKKNRRVKAATATKILRILLSLQKMLESRK